MFSGGSVLLRSEQPSIWGHLRRERETLNHQGRGFLSAGGADEAADNPARRVQLEAASWQSRPGWERVLLP